MYVCLLSWGPTDKVLLIKILLLREKQLLMNPPYAFASQLSKK